MGHVEPLDLRYPSLSTTIAYGDSASGYRSAISDKKGDNFLNYYIEVMYIEVFQLRVPGQTRLAVVVHENVSRDNVKCLPDEVKPKSAAVKPLLRQCDSFEV